MILEILPSAWMCSSFLSGGETSKITNCTGFLSIEPNSMGCAGFPIASTKPGSAAHFPCGIARPSPMPVERCVSRSHTARFTLAASGQSPFSVRRSTSSSRISCFCVECNGTRTQLGERSSRMRIALDHTRIRKAKVEATIVPTAASLRLMSSDPTNDSSLRRTRHRTRLTAVAHACAFRPLA